MLLAPNALWNALFNRTKIVSKSTFRAYFALSSLLLTAKEADPQPNTHS